MVRKTRMWVSVEQEWKKRLEKQVPDYLGLKYQVVGGS